MTDNGSISRYARIGIGVGASLVAVFVAGMVAAEFVGRRLDLTRAVERRNDIASRRVDRAVLQERLATARTAVDLEQSVVHGVTEADASNKAVAAVRELVEVFHPGNLSVVRSAHGNSNAQNGVPVEISLSVGSSEAVSLLLAIETEEPRIEVTRLRLDAGPAEKTGSVRIEAEVRVRRLLLPEREGELR